MQCVSCHFYNVPGTERCARCSAALRLDAVDVEPFRRGRGSLTRNTRDSAHRAGSSLADNYRRFRASSTIIPTTGDLSLALWGIVPGLGLYKMGARIRGIALLTLWLIATTTAVLFYGSPISMAAFALALTLHGISISLPLGVALDEGLHATLTRWIGAYLILALALYIPLATIATRRVVVATVPGSLAQGELLRAGDVLLFTGTTNRPESFRRGELVSVSANMHREASAWTIDRILAVAGDTLRFDSGTFLVNGRQPPPHAGSLLSRRGVMASFETVVPAGHVAVLNARTISYAPNASNSEISERIQRGIFLPLSEIRGRAFWRTWPPGRWGRFPAEAAH